MTTVNVISISGGKDSTAMWILAVKELGTENIIPVFADTGNEHPETYKYVEYLESQLGSVKRIKADFSEQIERKKETVNVKWRKDGVPEEDIQRALESLNPTGNPFLDLSIWKGRFPSTKARFCTQELKVIPIMEQVYFPLFEEGHKVVSWQGIRASESPARAKLPMHEEETAEGYAVYRPLLHWSARDVFDMHNKHGIEPNPLYLQGMGRVGCMPCINCRKDELFEIQRRFPEEIERIEEWEKIVSNASKRGKSSFFPALDDDWRKDIHDWVNWSKTDYGNYDLLKAIAMEEMPTCSSVYGLCE